MPRSATGTAASRFETNSRYVPDLDDVRTHVAGIADGVPSAALTSPRVSMTLRANWTAASRFGGWHDPSERE
jgi:hypothetical protein